MSVTADELATERPGGVSWLWRRQLNSYPDTRPRVTYLAITVLATIMLYYELYVGGSVSTLILVNLHMSFTFFVITLAFGNLIGAFGSLFAGLTDRLGRANLVVFGLLFTGVFVAFVLPAATDKWVFTIEGFVVGVVEGICLVATPALIRDFSPQVGRATAMGFWTSGPVLGSLIVSVVGTATVPVVVHDPRFWTHEYRICGIVGLVVFVIALIWLRELSPQLRDQLMVTMRDRALIEARAKGIDIEAALKHPFRQLLKPDVVVSAFAVSVMLIIYYTAVGFSVIYLTTVFGFSLKDANGLGNWNWGFNVIAVILIGMLSDRLRVRKPFMLIGGIAAAVMTVIYLLQAGLQPGYYSLAIILALLSFSLGVAYTPWMASFTETVEAHNPALTATGLAIWGWIIRVVVFGSFMLIPVVINSVTPLVNYGPQAVAYQAKYGAELAFAQQHPDVVALAQKYQTQIGEAQQFQPELTALQKDTVNVGTVFINCATPNKVPKAVMAQAVTAAGGGSVGQGVLTTMCQNAAAINDVIKVAGPLQKIQPYAVQLTALSKMPTSVGAFFKAHGAALQKASSTTVGQWKTWYWICFGGIVFFLLSIPLLRGRWRTRDAKRDEAEHEAKVQEELAKLQATV
ncbi:MAG TPA: MFS transporter [Streptosporangiaceae bacterium]|nr:MFS transporter [Streptosporangiaceae bacterium]